MKAIAAALILSLLAAPAAQASSKPKAKAEGPVSPYVNLDPVALPIVVNGRVVNYVFVTMRVDLPAGTPQATVDTVRAKEPYFRDALVRAAHRTPFTMSTDYTVIDTARATAIFLADARAIAGGNLVSGVRVMAQTPKSTRVAVSR
jgi:hypothetical protein